MKVLRKLVMYQSHFCIADLVVEEAFGAAVVVALGEGAAVVLGAVAEAEKMAKCAQRKRHQMSHSIETWCPAGAKSRVHGNVPVAIHKSPN